MATRNSSGAADVIVIGAGIIGASIAYYLTKLGKTVTVLDRALGGVGATAQSFAWINAHHYDSKAYFELRQASIEAYKSLSGELGSDLTLDWCGSLYYGLPKADLRNAYDRLTDLGYSIDLVGKEQFGALEPLVANPPDVCLHSKIEGAIDPVMATRCLLDHVSRAGSKTVFGAEVLAIEATSIGTMVVETTGGVHHTEKVVVAAGVQTAGLLKALNYDLPMDNRPGVIVHTRPVNPCIDHLVMGHGIHVRQSRSGALIAGEEFGGGSTAKSPSEASSNIVKRLQALLPNTNGIHIDRIMTGVRPMPLDGLPAVGYIDDQRSIYVASTHSGITLAPIIGKLAAGEVGHGQIADALKPFRPDRFRE